MKQPSFFIVGAPKSGTTALYSYLKQHPDIFTPRIKELNYFDRDLKSNKKAQNLDEYLNYFAGGENKVCGESSPTYLRSKVAAREIYSFNAQAKIIIMLREPVSLLYSYHSQLLYNGSSENIQDFQLALEVEPERKQGKKIPAQCFMPEALFYRDVVKFTEQIQRYFEVFPREQIKIIIFDDFQKNTANIYREILEFLQVDPNFQLERFTKKNTNKQVRSYLLQRLVKYPPVKVLELGKFLVPLPRDRRRVILEKFKNKLKKANTEYKHRSSLDAKLRDSLKQEFAPEIERLSSLLGRDLTYWSRN